MPGLSTSTIVAIWKDSKDARAVLDKGYRIVHASADYFYLVGKLKPESDRRCTH
jgi:hexosaminidase